MRRLRMISCGLPLLLAAAGCQSPPAVQLQPVAVACPQAPPPPAWVMEAPPSGSTLTQQLLDVFSPSLPPETKPSGS